MVPGQQVQTGTGNVREQKDVLGFARDNSGSVFQIVPLSSVYSQQELPSTLAITHLIQC